MNTWAILATPTFVRPLSSLRRFSLRTLLFTLTLFSSVGWSNLIEAAQVNLTWVDNSIGESGYKIERKLGSTGLYAEVASTGPNVTSYVDTGVVAGSTYCYRLRAFQAADYSPYSSEVCGSLASAISAIIPQTKWRLKFVDSQETVGGNYAAANAFDGSSSTMWHTQYVNGSALPPHEIQIDLGDTYTLNGFQYLPRQDGGVNGRVGKYEFYVSPDGLTWGSPVASGLFANDATLKNVPFTAKTGKFIRFRAVSEVNGNPWTAMAELKAIGILNVSSTANATTTSSLSSTPLTSPSAGQSGGGTKKTSAQSGSSTLQRLAIKIGVFRPRTGTLYIDQNSNGLWDNCSLDRCVKLFSPASTPPPATAWAALGLPPLPLLLPTSFDSFTHANEIPVKGDWTGTGRVFVGAFAPATGLWRLDLNGNGMWNGCTTDRCEGPLGQSGDIPVVGDWSAAGVSMIGVFDPHTGLWELDFNNNGVWEGCAVDLCLGPFGGAGDLPVILP